MMERIMSDDELFTKRCWDLKFWQEGQYFFTCRLFDLISGADRMNRYRIALGFPIEVRVWETWQASESPEDFYKKYCSD